MRFIYTSCRSAGDVNPFFSWQCQSAELTVHRPHSSLCFSHAHVMRTLLKYMRNEVGASGNREQNSSKNVLKHTPLNLGVWFRNDVCVKAPTAIWYKFGSRSFPSSTVIRLSLLIVHVSPDMLWVMNISTSVQHYPQIPQIFYIIRHPLDKLFHKKHVVIACVFLLTISTHLGAIIFFGMGGGSSISERTLAIFLRLPSPSYNVE